MAKAKTPAPKAQCWVGSEKQELWPEARQNLAGGSALEALAELAQQVFECLAQFLRWRVETAKPPRATNEPQGRRSLPTKMVPATSAAAFRGTNCRLASMS